MLGYFLTATGSTARMWRGKPDYVGESWTDDGPIRPESWSPNRLEFRVRPDQLVYVNQNPGSWWSAQRPRPLFPGRRCAETLEVFAARADEAGLLVLEIRPRGLGLGAGLHLAGLALIGSAWVVARRVGGQAPPGGSPDDRASRSGNGDREAPCRRSATGPGKLGFRRGPADGR